MKNFKLLRMDYDIPKKRENNENFKFENQIINFYSINQLTDLESLTISDFYGNFINIQIEKLRHLVIKTPEVPEFRENFQNLQILTLFNVDIFLEGCFINLKCLKMLKIVIRDK
ncbi:unnamed protein product [Brachionus calyciflorus]|uniref:Uncharacterized protein n=1 Tax=Brachionus calyciflorus TaxID=104777 RepID=A0A813NY10_9BILA|nr:unnamed protein product [Brachionus calyciflorus]